jgi:hypothetical protein
MGLGDEAEEARARLDAEAAAEDQRRRANWAAIDKLVQEFVANAVERQMPAHGGVFKKFWRVKHAQSKTDELLIWKNGDWALDRVHPLTGYDEPSRESLAFSLRGRKRDPKGPNPVEGLQEGVMRLLGRPRETAGGSKVDAYQSNRARVAQSVDSPASYEQRRQNWLAIDGLVQEFISEAVRRKTPKARGLLGGKKGWRVKHTQSDCDELWIYENGAWFYERDEPGGYRAMAFSHEGKTKGLDGPNVVEGFRDGAMRLLNR